MTREEVLMILEGRINFANLDTPANDLAAYCPFHHGQHANFYVYVGPTTYYVQTGAWFCQKCSEGGSFPSLLRRLNLPRSTIDNVQRYLKETTPVRTGKARLTFDLPVLPEMVLGMYEYLPKKLLEDGFTEEVLLKYEIGYDRERKRIIFPLRDHLGNLVGMSGRTVIDAIPRYKIYKEELRQVMPNYELPKGRLVWGLHQFYQASLSRVIEPVIVCEGFKAAMWVAQAGFPHVVALLGKSMTDEQATLVSRTTSRVVLFLDNDEPGIKALPGMAKQLGGLDVRFADYGTEEPVSPDDLTAEQVKAAVSNAVTPVQKRMNNKWLSTSKISTNMPESGMTP